MVLSFLLLCLLGVSVCVFLARRVEGERGGQGRGGGGGDFSRFLALEVVSFFFVVGCGVSVSRSLVTPELWI